MPVVAVILLAAGCSSGGQQVVFTQQSGFTFSFPAQTDEVADIGFSFGSLHNTTGHPVHLLSITFTPSPASLHVQNVLAYSWADLHDIGIYNATGVLAKECAARFKPHPLSVVTVAPHQDANYLVVIAFTFAKPGVYRLNQVRIDYQTQGHQGWQYQYIYTTITIKNPPLTNPAPLGPSGACPP